MPHIYFVRDSEQEKQRVAANDLVGRLQERGVVAITSMHLTPSSNIFGAAFEPAICW